MGAKRSLRTIEPRFDTNPGHGEFLGYRDEALGFREGLGFGVQGRFRVLGVSGV